ncbi:MAG: PaaI family thioesterase [Bdellovibrionota bacterium]
MNATLQRVLEDSAPAKPAFQQWARSVVAGKVPGPPIVRLLGFKMTEIGDGTATIELEAGPQHANPMGTLHGGVLCDITDAAMGTALASTLEAGESFTTIEIKGNFFKPIWTGTLRAMGKVVRRTKSLAYLEADVLDPDGSLVFKAASTCMILRGEQARGR